MTIDHWFGGIPDRTSELGRIDVADFWLDASPNVGLPGGGAGGRVAPRGLTFWTSEFLSSSSRRRAEEPSKSGRRFGIHTGPRRARVGVVRRRRVRAKVAFFAGELVRDRRVGLAVETARAVAAVCGRSGAVFVVVRAGGAFRGIRRAQFAVEPGRAEHARERRRPRPRAVVALVAELARVGHRRAGGDVAVIAQGAERELRRGVAPRADGAPARKPTAGPGRPDQTLKLSSSVTSFSDESIALTEISKHRRRSFVETVAYAHIDVGLKI